MKPELSRMLASIVTDLLSQPSASYASAARRKLAELRLAPSGVIGGERQRNRPAELLQDGGPGYCKKARRLSLN